MGQEPRPPSFMERIRPYLDRAREYLDRAGVHLQRGWEATRHGAVVTWASVRQWTLAVWAWTLDRTERFTGSLGERIRARREARAARAGASTDAGDGRRQRLRRRDAPLSLDAAIVVARPEDDAGTITGRIDTADDLEVALVVPRSARRLRQASVWPHLAAHARRRGIVLRVVSPRRDVRAHARANGLRAASRLRQLQRGPMRLGLGEYSVRLPALPLGGLFRLAIVAGIVVAIGWFASYRLPSATITIVPNAEEYSVTREVRVSATADSSDIETGIVAGISVRESITTLITAETTGETEVGVETATTTLVFTNEGNSQVLISAGAQVRDEDDLVSFVILEDIDVPADGSIEAPAEAAIPGTIGNVAANTLTVGEGLPGGVTVTNPAAAVGGTNEIVRAVAEEDVERARAIADDVLRVVAERSLENLLSEQTLLFPETLSTAIFSEIPFQQLDEPAEVLLVEYVIVVSAIALDPARLTDFGAQMLREELPATHALLPGTATVIAHDDATVDAGQIRVTVEATGLVASVDQFAALAEDIAGMRPAEAQALIEERVAPLGPPDIEINPAIIPWRWLPRSADRIEIVLAGPAFLEPEEEDEEEPVEEEQLPEEIPIDPEELEPPEPPDGAEAARPGTGVSV